MTVKRALFIGVAALAILVTVAGGFAAWLAGTEGGAGFIVRRGVLRLVPGLSIADIRGSFLDGLVLTGLRFESERIDVAATSAALELDLVRLLDGTVAFRDVRISSMDVRTSTGSIPRESGDDRAADLRSGSDAPRLPVAVVVDSATIDSLVFVPDGRPPANVSRMTLAGAYVDDVLQISRLGMVWQAYDLSAQGRLRLSNVVDVDATISVAGSLGDQDLLASARLNGGLPILDIDAELVEPSAMTATGTIELDAGPAFDLALEWARPDIELVELSGLAGLTVGSGSAGLTGHLDNIDFSIASTVTLSGAPVDLTAAGRYAAETILFDTFRLTRGESFLEASGRLDPAARTYDFSLTGEALDPALFFADWAGRIQVRGDVAGTFGDRFSIASPGLELGGVLRGYPFTGSFAGAYRGTRNIDVQRARLSVGDNEVDLTGRVTQELALEIDATLGDLSQLHDALSGSLAAEYSVTGSLKDPSFEGVLEADRLAVADSSVDSLVIAGTLGLTRDSAVDFTVRAVETSIGDVALGSLDSTVTGTATDHVMELTAVALDWRAAARLRGGLTESFDWTGAVDDLELGREPFGAWRLRDPTPLTVINRTFALQSGCLFQNDAEICGAFRIGGEQPEMLRIRATDFDVGLLEPFMPPAAQVHGRYDLDVDLSAFLSNPVGSVHAAGRETVFGFRVGEDDIVELRLASVSFDGDVDAQGYRASLDIEGSGTDRINASLEGGRLSDLEAPVAGTLRADWSSVAGLSLLSPNVGEVGGRIVADMSLGGSLAAPQFDGQASISDGSIELPEWGVVIEGIAAQAFSPEGRSIEFDATGLIGGNALRLTGTTVLDASAGWPTRLRLTGDRVEVVQIADADIVVSPDLQIEVDLPVIVVRGAVDVPSALITIEELPAQAVRPSADSVVHGIEAPERPAPIILNADIELRLGEEVRYEGAGLSIDLAGELRLRYSTLTSSAAAGSVTVSGLYEAFGQELTLERGELIFNGPLNDPTLNIRAVRRIESVTVGIDLTGTLQRPVSRIFSEPVMAEADAVSYLLFGRPLAVPDGSDPNQLRNAAVSLGLRQAVPVIQRIGDTIGLDEFAIESTDFDTGELMAGKFLSPKLYVRYTYGLFNRIGGLLLRYRLSERVSLETRSGDQKSMDLLFEIERD